MHSFSCNKEGVELFQISKDKTGFDTNDTVYINDTNSVAVSAGFGGKRCISDSSATIIWACLSLLRTKIISQGFASTTTPANF
jgi:hypothetical protein